MITAICSLSNNNFVTGSLDTSLKIWDIRTGKILKKLNGHTHAVIMIAELSNLNIVSTSLDKTIIIWSYDGMIINTLEGFDNPVMEVV